MMRFISLSVFFLSIFIGFALLVAKYPGYILIAIGNKTIEMQAWTGIMIIGIPLLWIVCTRLWKIWRVLAKKRIWFFKAYLYKSEELTTSGMSHFIAGNWRAAKKDFLKAAAGAKDPTPHYLAAARSAFASGDKKMAQELVQKAENNAKENDLSVILAQADMLLHDNQYEQCLALLNRARGIEPNHPTILRLLKSVYFSLNDWQGLQSLLPILEKKKLLSKSEKEKIEERVYLELLCSAGEDLQSDIEKNLPTFEALWNSLPKNLQLNTALVETYVRYLLLIEKNDQAELLVRKSLNHEWNDLLVEKYGLIQSSTPQNQLSTAELWLKNHPEDAVLHLSIARLCLRNEQWGKAQKYLESSISINPTPEAHAELGRLLAYLGHYDESNESYQNGLLLSTNSLPNLPMPSV